MGFGAVLTHSRLSLRHRRHVSSDGLSGSPKSHLSFLPKVGQRKVSALAIQRLTRLTRGEGRKEARAEGTTDLDLQGTHAR
jgi:hypothetical protein